jgi:L-lactate dehydrogenase complex protein LldF
VTGIAMRALAVLAGRHGSFFKLPLAGGWTRTREFPAPEGRTFRELWRMRGRA